MKTPGLFTDLMLAVSIVLLLVVQLAVPNLQVLLPEYKYVILGFVLLLTLFSFGASSKTALVYNKHLRFQPDPAALSFQFRSPFFGTLEIVFFGLMIVCTVQIGRAHV